MAKRPPKKRFKKEIKQRRVKPNKVQEELLRRQYHWAQEQLSKHQGKMGYWLTCAANFTITNPRIHKVRMKIREQKSLVVFWEQEIRRLEDLLNYNPEKFDGVKETGL